MDGGYTPWSDFGPCNTPCGTGIQVRHRNCTNPTPKNNGKDCFRFGNSYETKACHNIYCPGNIHHYYTHAHVQTRARTQVIFVYSKEGIELVIQQAGGSSRKIPLSTSIQYLHQQEEFERYSTGIRNSCCRHPKSDGCYARLTVLATSRDNISAEFF